MMDDSGLAGLLRMPGVSAAHVVDLASPELVGASASVHEIQGAVLGAIVAALQQATADLDIGALDEVIVEAGGGSIVASVLPGGQAVIAVAREKGNLGMIRLELRRLRRGG